jgi:hypothetical protein
MKHNQKTKIRRNLMNRSTILANTFQIMALLALFVPATQASEICAGSCPISNAPPISAIELPPITFPLPFISQPLLMSGSSQTSDGWSYNFGFSYDNLNPVNSFTLPYFTDEQISSVKNPSGWSFETGNNDVFGLGQGAGYMRWTYIGTPPIDVNPGFSFLSPWAPGLAAFNYTQIDKTTYVGSGINIPISPLAITDGLIPPSTAIPVPPALIPFLTALAGLTFASRHSKGRNLVL